MHMIKETGQDPECLLEDWSYLEARTNFIPRGLILDFAVRASYHISGNIVEFGVATGDSTRKIRATLDKLEVEHVEGQRKKVFAFDSFKGLPEKFENAEVGTFAGEVPKISGVEIVEGYFQESLTQELAVRVGKVSFASLDADLYSSTLCALQWLTPLLHTGSILLFDEFLGEKESEKRAFEAWSEESGVRTIKIADLLRQPSGWGEKIDRRTLFQVVGSEELQTRPIARVTDSSKLRKYLGPFARRLRSFIK